MLLITAMSLSSFALPVHDVNDRLQISMTMVLTSVAFKLQVADCLTNLAYLTFIDKRDKFILICFGFITAMGMVYSTKLSGRLRLRE